MSRPGFWNSEKTLILIAEYRRHELLWNPRHHLRLQHSAREFAYNSMCNVFGKPVMSRRLVVNRINYLRARYRDRCTILSRNPAANQPDWYRAMHEFLAPVTFITRRSNAGDQREPVVDHSEISQLSNHSYGGQSNANNTGVQLQLQNQHDQAAAAADCNGLNQTANGHRLSPSDSHPPNYRFVAAGAAPRAPTNATERFGQQLRILEDLEQNVQRSMHSLRSLVQAEAEAEAARSLQQTEFDALGRNIALQLGQLELNEALHCQMALQGVLRTFRLRQQQNQQQKQQQQQPPSNVRQEVNAVDQLQPDTQQPQLDPQSHSYPNPDPNAELRQQFSISYAPQTTATHPSQPQSFDYPQQSSTSHTPDYQQQQQLQKIAPQSLSRSLADNNDLLRPASTQDYNIQSMDVVDILSDSEDDQQPPIVGQ